MTIRGQSTFGGKRAYYPIGVQPGRNHPPTKIRNHQKGSVRGSRIGVNKGENQCGNSQTVLIKFNRQGEKDAGAEENRARGGMPREVQRTNDNFNGTCGNFKEIWKGR